MGRDKSTLSDGNVGRGGCRETKLGGIGRIGRFRVGGRRQTVGTASSFYRYSDLRRPTPAGVTGERVSRGFLPSRKASARKRGSDSRDKDFGILSRR